MASRDHMGELPKFEKPTWFGVTVGSLAFAALAKESEEARNLVAQELGLSSVDEMAQVPVITVAYPEADQQGLTEHHGDQILARVA